MFNRSARFIIRALAPQSAQWMRLGLRFLGLLLALLGLTATGCRATAALPAQTATVVPFPTFTATPNISAVSTTAGEIRAVPAPPTQSTPETATPPLLPAPFYFLGENGQIWRIEDGFAATQITQEQTPISAFDYAPAHGRLIYVTADGSLLVESDPATGERVVKIVYELPADLPADFADQAKLAAPRYSPDGTRIAFVYNGIYLMASGLPTADSATLLQANVGWTEETQQNVGRLRTYHGVQWSPSGADLLFSVGLWEGGGYELYNLQTGTLTPINRPDGEYYVGPIGSWYWGYDEQRGYIAVSSLMAGGPGLFRFDRARGLTTQLQTTLPSPQDTFYPTGTVSHGVYETESGALTLFLSMKDVTDIYQLYRLEPGAAPTLLNATPVQIAGEVLWAADGRGVLVTTRSGRIQWLTPAGGVHWLIEGHNLRWEN